MTIALVHLLFNICGTVLVYPIPFLRAIPLKLARGLASAAIRSRWWVVVYVVVVFVLVPLGGWLIWR